MVVSTVEVLLLGLGSGVVEVTSAVLVIVLVAVLETIPLIIIILEAPAANVPIL